jgi:polysaccharide export outer membrane protein
MKFNYTLLVIFSFSVLSCGLNRELAYFKTQSDSTLSVAQQSFEPKIQQGDILFIGINSSDPLSSAQFNSVNAVPANGAVGTNSLTQNVTPGLLVDINGNIQLPKIGLMYAKGKTKAELTKLIQDGLIPYLKDPIVSIRFMNYRVTVLGEVARPMTINVSNERISILEALGMTGDLTAYGNRTNVLIIHENEGKKEFHRVNLNKMDLFKSPYFYLQSNDVVYVEPNKAKSYLGSETSVYLPAIISSASLLILVINNFFK